MNPKQARFCTEYIVDMNATRAAIRAGYSKKTAASQGERLLRNVEIEKRVGELRQEQEGRTLIEADDVVMGLHTEATREGEGSSHSARVSAWGHLAKITGAVGPKGTRNDPHCLETVDRGIYANMKPENAEEIVIDAVVIEETEEPRQLGTGEKRATERTD